MWYVVNLLFKSEGCEPESELLWEERMVIFHAESEEGAVDKGRDWGLGQETSYRAVDGGNICWRFHSVERCLPLEESAFRDGLEIFWRFLKQSEAESLREPFSG